MDCLEQVEGKRDLVVRSGRISDGVMPYRDERALLPPSMVWVGRA